MISGKPVKSSMARTSMPASVELLRGAARRDDLDAELGEAAGEVDDPALVGDRQQRAADPDGAGLGRAARRWRSARRCPEHRGGAGVRAPSRGNTGRCAAEARDRRSSAWRNARRPIPSAARAHAATSSRSASGGSTTTSTTRARRRKARREDAEAERATPPATGRTPTTMPAARTPRLRRPRGRRGRRGGLGARLRRPAITRRGWRGRGAAARGDQRDRLGQQLVLERPQAPRGPRPGRVASGSSTARCRMIGPVSTPSSTRWTVTPKTLTP